MTRRAAMAMLLGLAGCGASTSQGPRAGAEPSFFAASAMHASPVFTKVADFRDDQPPDGIEAVVEIQDRFGDPTKAAGVFHFQVYAFKPYNPDPRGERIAGPFEGRVDTPQDQRNRWDKVNRAYIFPLAFAGASLSADYVLETTFETPDGRRLNDRLILEGDHDRPTPATGPSPLVPAVPSSASSGGSSSTAVAPASDPAGAIVTQERNRVPVTSQPHEPPARADQP